MDYKKDFPMLNKGIVYLDNSATTFKPKCVIDEVSNYYSSYSANAHRGDYNISQIVDDKLNNVREETKKFINAKKACEIVFTSGATESLNFIIKGFLKDYLKSGDEILTTKSEHASLILPLFEVANKKEVVINYIDLNPDLTVSLENVKKKITKKTKAIVLSHVTNVIGDIRPIKEICEYAHKTGIIVIVDGAQSVPHQKVDVRDLDVDFLSFSAHKMLGPTGVGVLYGKEKYLNLVKPLIEGGGMNAFFDSLGNIEYKELPEKLEAGTQNLAGIFGFGEAINYINKVGIDNIHKKEIELKKYMIDKMSKLKNITIYNKDIEKKMNIAYFKMLIPMLKQCKVGVCFENLYEGMGQRIVEGVCADPYDAVWYIDTLNEMAGEELFGFCLDTGHLQLVKRDPYEFIKVMGSRLKVLHIHENDAIGDLHQMPYTFGNSKDDGQIWERLYKGLKDTGFNGTLSFETYPCVNSFPKPMTGAVLKTICDIGKYMAESIDNA